MNLFRFCRQGLIALPVFLLFSACDKLLPTSGNGGLVPVKIRSVSVRGYGEASATRSTGGEKRIVGQPIIRDLGGGMLAEITVEEDVSALRAGDTYLADTVKFRVIAVDSDNKVYSYGDYGFAEGAPVLTNNTNLHVLNGVNYNYIFISYNNSTLPPAPEEGDDLSNVTIAVAAGSNDLLWQTISNPQPDSDGVPVLNFNDIKHQLARVTLVLDANTNRTITNVAAGSITLNAASSGSFKLTNGTFVSSSGTTNFSGWTPAELGVEEVTSGATTFIPQAKYTYTIFSFAKEAVTVGGDALPTVARTVGSSYKFRFEAGHSYTVSVTLKEVTTSNKFAGSNIYWDDEEEELTFEPYSSTGEHKEYQGVFFKWGSLIGISPAQTGGSDSFSSGTTASSGQTDGTPIYMKDPDGNWVKTNVAYATSQNWISGSGWDAIPSHDGTVITESALVGDNAYSLLAKSGSAPYLGDICNYINPAYRMPTGNELKALGTGSSGSGDWTWTGSGSATSSDATGRQVFTQFGTFTKTGTSYILPASGYRLYNSGTLGYVSRYGYYWSGSTPSGTGNYLEFGSSGNAIMYHTYRSFGFPVRCVLNE